MWLEEWEWKIGGRIKAVAVVLLTTLLVWHAGGRTAIGPAVKAWQANQMHAILECRQAFSEYFSSQYLQR